MPEYQEGGLALTIPESLESIALDRMPRKPQGMKFVDLVLHQESRTLLLEIKDPAHPNAPAAERQRFAAALSTDELISQTLTPKARDSYTFLHLMQRDDRPMLFVVLLGADRELVAPAELDGFRLRLLRRLLREADEPWRRPYVTDCIVATPETWPRHFPDLALRRLSSRREPEDGDTDR